MAVNVSANAKMCNRTVYWRQTIVKKLRDNVTIRASDHRTDTVATQDDSTRRKTSKNHKYRAELRTRDHTPKRYTALQDKNV